MDATITKPDRRYKLAIVWRGDAAARLEATPYNNRFVRIFESLAAEGIEVAPAVYDEAFADDVRAQLLAVDGVLVWVNPLQQGKTRSELDQLLRDVSERGVWVSAHPDVILKIGVKDVLYQTRHFGWGGDTHRYLTAHELRSQFPARLLTGARVLKQNRGNDGQGVWKVEVSAGEKVRVLHALRGSGPEELALASFLERCEEYFGWGGCIIDQAFQPRLPEGMIRCYMSGSRVCGYGHQLIKALVAPPPSGPDSPEAQPGPRIMYGPDDAAFQMLRSKMESEWVPALIKILEIAPADLPAIWDADFLYGPRDASGADTYVLCEINASSCFAVPDQAPAAIARYVKARLSQREADVASVA